MNLLIYFLYIKFKPNINLLKSEFCCFIDLTLSFSE